MTRDTPSTDAKMSNGSSLFRRFLHTVSSCDFLLGRQAIFINAAVTRFLYIVFWVWCFQRKNRVNIFWIDGVFFGDRFSLSLFDDTGSSLWPSRIRRRRFFRSTQPQLPERNRNRGPYTARRTESAPNVLECPFCPILVILLRHCNTKYTYPASPGLGSLRNQFRLKHHHSANHH